MITCAWAILATVFGCFQAHKGWLSGLRGRVRVLPVVLDMLPCARLVVVMEGCDCQSASLKRGSVDSIVFLHLENVRATLHSLVLFIDQSGLDENIFLLLQRWSCCLWHINTGWIAELFSPRTSLWVMMLLGLIIHREPAEFIWMIDILLICGVIHYLN